MTFSQGWDTGFKSVLLYVGIVFGWLIFIEPQISKIEISVPLMNLVAVSSSGIFFFLRRRSYIAKRRAAEAEVEAILAKD